MQQFDKTTGWQGEEKWRLETWDRLEQALHDKKLLPNTENIDVGDIMNGLIKGYPDIAILDFAEWRASRPVGSTEEEQNRLDEEHYKTMAHVNIPYVGTYEEAQPGYMIHPDHLEYPEVKNNVEEAGKILEEFYQSEWHQQISKDPNFKAKLHVES